MILSYQDPISIYRINAQIAEHHTRSQCSETIGQAQSL